MTEFDAHQEIAASAQGIENTDRMLYVTQADDYWSDSIWLTSQGICIKVKGHAITRTLEAWHQLALDAVAREPVHTADPAPGLTEAAKIVQAAGYTISKTISPIADTMQSKPSQPNARNSP